MQKRGTTLQYLAFLLSFMSIKLPLSLIIIAAFQRDNAALKPFVRGVLDGLRESPLGGQDAMCVLG
jgi:hypothetical protein